MAITADELKKLIEAEIDCSFCQVIDESGGCGAMFKAIVVSDSFQGVGILDRQRKVNTILKKPLETIHALTLKTWTVADYEKKKHEL